MYFQWPHVLPVPNHRHARVWPPHDLIGQRTIERKHEKLPNSATYLMSECAEIPAADAVPRRRGFTSSRLAVGNNCQPYNACLGTQLQRISVGLVSWHLFPCKGAVLLDNGAHHFLFYPRRASLNRNAMVGAKQIIPSPSGNHVCSTSNCRTCAIETNFEREHSNTEGIFPRPLPRICSYAEGGSMTVAVGLCSQFLRRFEKAYMWPFDLDDEWRIFLSSRESYAMVDFYRLVDLRVYLSVQWCRI